MYISKMRNKHYIDQLEYHLHHTDDNGARRNFNSLPIDIQEELVLHGALTKLEDSNFFADCWINIITNACTDVDKQCMGLLHTLNVKFANWHRMTDAEKVDLFDLNSTYITGAILGIVVNYMYVDAKRTGLIDSIYSYFSKQVEADYYEEAKFDWFGHREIYA